jgi:phosphohistidine phosphatase
MTKTLYLLRHGKSGFAKGSQTDADRTLTGRGRKAGKRMGKELARRGWIPDLVLCSSATRTRQTYDRFAKGLEKIRPGAMPAVVFEDTLYLAGIDTLLARVRAVADEVTSAMIIGHNFGLQDFALELPANGGPLMDKIAAKFPTCALAVIRFEIDRWNALLPGKGRLEEVLYPRDLG